MKGGSTMQILLCTLVIDYVKQSHKKEVVLLPKGTVLTVVNKNDKHTVATTRQGKWYSIPNRILTYAEQK
jgi:hypothetical protein